ncbi:MAG: cyclase family protein [Flavobacteriaceae bacterium]
MELRLKIGNQWYQWDFDKGIDLSISLKNDGRNPAAWYVDAPEIQAVRQGDFIGKVSEGGSTNFNWIRFNPHAHMTHTECLGHITEEFYSINSQLKEFHFPSYLITVAPKEVDGDLIIDLAQLKARLSDRKEMQYAKALLIRTLPNDASKISRNYEHSNPPYFSREAMEFIVGLGIEHLLVDLPSVDKEKDGGALVNHNIFWQTQSEESRKHATITEFIYVNEEIHDGFYLLDLAVAPIENDASPSRPVIYQLDKIDL